MTALLIIHGILFVVFIITSNSYRDSAEEQFHFESVSDVYRRTAKIFLMVAIMFALGMAVCLWVILN